ncbi:phosphatidylserine decarboxylase [Povalibacter uvarum]|uniref:Phosphatidylserine decarboxylase proenzyme n=1 Tax=Povalibacter uvarum TaxID=732238 RepID=A0A841HGU0_9GAMM|nr:archaetidylserine decarboxylase [Povalibacter uvarum]MBB6091560.1 phosphatidylserine decarboxylase [Povalibacter uvarum]
MTDRVPDSDTPAALGDRLFAALQYVLPKHLLSRLIYHVMRAESPAVRKLIISSFLRGYDVNMAEAVQSDPFAYRSFNDFFTRALKPGARPIDPAPAAIVSPVDGTLSQRGGIHDGKILQAKGQHYTLAELLANDTEAVEAYRDGSFACIYLAPYNYHRIHMPFAGRALSTVYVPGDLFSVNAATARTVPRLFSRNERVICDFDTTIGRMAMILVGALFVGSMETVHCGEINPPPRPRKAAVRIDRGNGRDFARGEELGRFNMGSTVVLLFQRNRVRWDDAFTSQMKVQLGRPIARTSSIPS